MATIIQQIFKSLFYQFAIVNPADSTSYGFSSNSIAPTTIGNSRQFKFPKGVSVINEVDFTIQQSANPSGENVELLLRNVTTGIDQSIGIFAQNFGAISTTFQFDNLNVVVNDTEFFCWHYKTPAFVTNPSGVLGSLEVKAR